MLLQSLCFALGWLFILSLLWSSYRKIKQGISTVKLLHQIPCSNCKFFTNNYQLKCTVNPKIALTEAAINCSDYSPY